MAGGSGRLPQRVLGTVAMPQRNGQMWWVGVTRTDSQRLHLRGSRSTAPVS